MPEIRDSVGAGGTNAPHDVAMVQLMLRLVKNAKNAAYLGVDYTGIYDDIGRNRTPDVFAVGLDPQLKVVFRAAVTPPDRGHSDQFFPAAAVDAQTGVFAACWYDTTFDPHQHRSWFTCSTSPNGQDWDLPRRAAAEPTLSPKICPTSIIKSVPLPSPSRAAAKCSTSLCRSDLPIGPHPNFTA